MEEQLVRELKPFINKGHLEGLKNIWCEYQETDFGQEIAWDYIFQKVYLHACLKKKQNIINWFMELYKLFNPIVQIAMKHVFVYGKYLQHA
jgi:hypothetical protein